jgi:hypothetical protein
MRPTSRWLPHCRGTAPAGQRQQRMGQATADSGCPSCLSRPPRPTHRGGKGHGTAGSGGARRRRPRGTSGYLRGRTPAPQGRRRQAPQDRRRRLTFFWGWAEIRRSHLWSLKVMLDALRVHAAQYKTRPSHAEHVAGRAGPAEARGASQLLAGNRRVPGAGTPGSIAELQGAGWAAMH